MRVGSSQASASAASFYKIGMQLVFAGGLGLIDELTGAGKRDLPRHEAARHRQHGGRRGREHCRARRHLHHHPRLSEGHARGRRGAAGRGGRFGLLGVTALTSMDDADLARRRLCRRSRGARRGARARTRRDAGMDGIVCSPHEAGAVRKIVGPDMAIVTPGVRPAGSAAGDQKRVMTPGEAIAAGADLHRRRAAR